MINSRFGLSVLISALALVSCGEQTSKEKTDTALAVKIVSDTLSKKETKLPQKFMQNTIGTFYVMGDKNAGTPDDAKLSKWVFPFVQQLSENGINPSENLFLNGAGPMGAQLNPGADILVAAYFNGDVDTNSVLCSFNDYAIKPAHFSITNSNGNKQVLCWFIVQQRPLNVGRHNASSAEIKEICDLRGMDESKWIKNSCSVVKFSVSGLVNGGEIKLQNYLMMTFDK